MQLCDASAVTQTHRLDEIFFKLSVLLTWKYQIVCRDMINHEKQFVFDVKTVAMVDVVAETGVRDGISI